MEWVGEGRGGERQGRASEEVGQRRGGEREEAGVGEGERLGRRR